MSVEPRNVQDVARLLRQREDLGFDEIFLEGLTREQVLRAIYEARGEVRGGAPADREGAPEPDRAPEDPSELDGPAIAFGVQYFSAQLIGSQAIQ